MKSFLFVMAVAALLAGAVQSKDTTTFRVDSYIPKYFRDFEWKVDLGANAAGSTSPNHSVSRNNTYNSESDNSGSSRSLNFVSSQRFRRITRSNFLNIIFLGRVSPYTGTARNESYSAYQPPPPENYGNQRSTMRSWEGQLNPAIELGNYLGSSSVYLATSIWSNWKISERKDEIANNYVNQSFPIFDTGTGGRAYSSSNHLGQSQFSATLGYGRIYEGWYASTALNMIHELRSAGLQLREPNLNEMQTLCDSVFFYRFKHAIDSRRQRILTISSLTRYLLNIGIIADSSATSCLTIADVWDYFPQESRPFGWRISVGSALRYYNSSYRETRTEWDSTRHRHYSYIDSTLADSTISIRKAHGYSYSKRMAGDWVIHATFEYHRPLSLRWQFDLSGTAWGALNDYGIIRTVTIQWQPVYSQGGKQINKHDANSVGGDASVVFRYFADARTSASLAVSFVAGWPFSGYYDNTYSITDYVNSITSDRPSWDHSRNDYLALKPEIQRRLSIPTTLILNGVFDWNVSRRDSPSSTSFGHRFSYSVSMELIHNIF